MNAKHSVGPWTFGSRENEDGTFNPNGSFIPIISDEHRDLARVVWKMNGEKRSPRCEANARLILASPALLAACVEFVRKVDCGEARSTRSYKQMKAAIAMTEVSE